MTYRRIFGHPCPNSAFPFVFDYQWRYVGLHLLNITKSTFVLTVCVVLSIVFATGSAASQISPSTVTGVQIRGNRRIPSERIRSELQTKIGGVVDLTTVSRDVRALYSLGYFDDVQFETETTGNGPIIIFSVKEKPLVRAIEYKGIHSGKPTEVGQTLALSKKGLAPESVYSVAKATETASVLKSLLATKGHPEAIIGIATQLVPPNSVKVVFVIDEGK